MENLKTKIMPEKVLFQENSIDVIEPETGKYRIAYEDIVYAYIRIRNREEENCLKPEITEITKETDGELILYDREHRQWVIGTDRVGKKAGTLFEELCIHVPYILAGGQDWFDCSEEKDFEMIGQMVNLMRACSR